MNLSNDLISQFVKITNDSSESKPSETTVYGTARKEADGSTSVMLDGSDRYTPVPITANVKTGDRVVVHIKNHSAIITGNLTNPAVATGEITDMTDSFDELTDQVSSFETILANKVDTEVFNAEVGRIGSLETNYATVREELDANKIVVDELVAEDVKIKESISANTGEINSLKTEKLDATFAESKYATIENLESANTDIYNLNATHAEFVKTTTDKFKATDASIEELQADKLSAKDIEGKYANIDFSNIGEAAIERFYATSGLIEDVVVDNGTITGRLVGVTISGDLIEGNTVKAEKLVIKGSDGLYYKLNTDGVTTEAEQTDQNSLNGSVIKAKSITASKISVSDLVAFDATIGGFNITEESLYSGAKESVSNTTRGIYLDSEGQAAIGDSSNFIKYYKDASGAYKLAISASSIIFAANNKSVETAINEVQESVDNLEIGSRNLLLKSASKQITPYNGTVATHEYGVEVTEWHTTNAMRIYGTGGNAVIFGTLGGTSNNGASDENQSYATSIYIKNNHATNSMIVSANHLASIFQTIAPQEVTRVELVGHGNGWGYLQINFKTEVIGDEFDITYWHPKLERGTKPTDWTPAPEDMATGEDLDIVESVAESAKEKATSTESLIQQLSDSISMLVTDGNGTSLMTQTEDGWMFSTAEIQTAVNNISENLDTLTNELGDTSSAVNLLKQAVDNLETIAEYVKIKTYEGEPCIELGEGDSEFKLRITNTRMIFTEGHSVLAYFNNQSFHVKKAVVEEELQQGGFIWKARSNGNLGLIWKGVTS